MYLEAINQVSQSSNLELRKWSSNCPKLDKSPALVPMKLSDEMEAVKALGNHWHPNEDEFGFKINLTVNTVNTKRQMISDALKLFDPVGWLAPVIVKIKNLYQHLWL